MHESNEPANPAVEGSMASGFAMGCLVPIGASMVIGTLLGMLSGLPGNSNWLGLVGMGGLLTPLLAYLAVLVWATRKGPRTVKGVLAAGATAIGLVVLLVAACFGLLATGGFNNMH